MTVTLSKYRICKFGKFHASHFYTCMYLFPHTDLCLVLFNFDGVKGNERKEKSLVSTQGF